jgi:O-antigen/teichoic acid export membrane protein
MIDKFKHTFKQAGFYSIANMASKLSGFILLPIYSQHLSLSMYGLVALFDSITDILFVVANLGIDNGFKRWYWDHKNIDKKKSLFFTMIVFTILATLFFSVVFLGVLNLFSKQIFDMELSFELLSMFALSSFLRITFMKILFLMRNQQKAKKKHNLFCYKSCINNYRNNIFLIISRFRIHWNF